LPIRFSKRPLPATQPPNSLELKVVGLAGFEPTI
jgi:hypothetical protein